MPAPDLPRPVLKVAFSKGPYDTVLEEDWTDLSDRIKSVSSQRGRRSARDNFDPGTLTVELSNADRMLDPANPSGYVYTADRKGLPMCPVTLDLVWNGSTYRRFTGYLGTDNWGHAIGRGKRADLVTLQAVDAMAYSPNLPESLWSILAFQLAHTDYDIGWWYLPMETNAPVVGDGSSIPNRSGSGGAATFKSPAAGPLLGASQSDNPAITGNSPYLRMPAESYIVSDAADVMPDGDELDLTVALWWKPDDGVLDPGDAKVIARMTYPGGAGNDRWLVQAEDDGKIHIYTYDAAGAAIDSAEIDDGYGDWSVAANNWHLVIVRFDSGNNMDVWVGGYQASLTAAAAVYESDLIIGPSPTTNTYVDEVIVWRTALVDDDVAGLNLAAGYSLAWFGFSHANAMGAFYQAIGKVPGLDEQGEWHLPVSDVSYGFYGLSAQSSLPSDLVGGARLVAGPFGAAWVTKDGFLRVRTIDALTDATYAANYAAVSANFTDENATLTAPDYRHAGMTLTGAQLDRVVNEASITFPHMTTAGDITTTQYLTGKARDQDSIVRFGRRSDSEVTLAWHGFDRAATVIDTIIERYAWPIDEVQELSLDATGDPDLTEWLTATCELELAVTVSYTPTGDEADRVTIEDLNIQQESWTLNVDKTFKAALVVAKS